MLTPDSHGPFCHRRPAGWHAMDEQSTVLRHRAIRYGGMSALRSADGCPPLPEAPAEETQIDNCAYVVLLFGSDVEYAVGALLVANSLRHAGAKAKIVMLYTQDVPQDRIDLSKLFFDEVRLIQNPVQIPLDSPLCVHSRDFGHPQFMKLHLMELEFDKVLYLDCDTIVRKNVDHLFTVPAPAAMERLMAMPRHGDKLPNRIHYEGSRIRGLQGGVMLFAPDKEMFEKMRRDVEGWTQNSDLRSFRASVGNEQDYLTWRYCEDMMDEDSPTRVWTHLGCEYNFEVHQPKSYYAVGRERWLWMDFEKDAAILHYSAPLRKRAKHLLRACTVRDAEDVSDTEEEEDEDDDEDDGRIEFARRVWDEHVALLRAEIAKRGVDLTKWLGAHAGAHKAAFAVEDIGTTKRITQLPRPEDAGQNCLVFEAFTANCATGLEYHPPGFMPGPPWGAAFWARKEKWASLPKRDCLEAAAREAEIIRTKSADDKNAEVLAVAAESLDASCGVSSLHAGAVTNGLVSKPMANGIIAGCAVRASDAQGEKNENCNRAPVDEPKAGCTHEPKVNGTTQLTNDAGPPGSATVGSETELNCDCALRKHGAPALASSTIGKRAAVGAWLRVRNRGGSHYDGDSWDFGLVDDPPHLPDCQIWRMFSAFRVKIAQR